jgi:hypothetical protein
MMYLWKNKNTGELRVAGAHMTIWWVRVTINEKGEVSEIDD